MSRPKGRRTVELFAGGGGLALGLERAGWEHVALVDFDPVCCATLRANRPSWHVLQDDVAMVDLSKMRPVDLLAAAPPCQPYSERGYQKGTEDERNGWPATFAAIDKLKPRWVVAENIAALEGTLDHSRVIFELRDRFNWVATWKLNAADFGAAQDRERLFLVAGPGKAKPPTPTHLAPGAGGLFRTGPPWVGVRQALGLPAHTTGLFRGHGYLPDRLADLDKPIHALTTLSFGTGTGLRLNTSGVLTAREEATIAATPRDPYGRLYDRPPDGWKWEGQVGRKVVDGLRRLTDEELQILAGFPSEWVFSGPFTSRVKQRGNSVVPVVGEAVGRALIEADG